MTALQVQMKKPLTKTRLIGFAALGVCAVGYTGMGLALLAGKMDYLDMTHAALLAAVAALIGEIGLWVGAGCLGLTLFKKRKAMLDKLLGRSPKPATPTAEV
ncbi:MULTISPECIES: hypothetical protein [unclassified Brevundimonas]|uniref:hypothetical protein n=1 Tax=unclassified Brevundimonas TaxID=2622653 RepID=UPI000CFD1F53|nr:MULTISPECIES: hypothetical protein [unclassified Brevundimonas]PRA35316.1 hypothetical protein CQ024_02600 [Brevundimonas sp. MYb27]PQZ82936.1 hypothetical protein CQ026_06735 [Brevundimonas sp. MYb31]PRB15042.1 hypothetical protein CQ039_09240 [Brevundimonas sp. MYb52]PRB36857.1 hypothetical protein CQ035_04175 [Brevundimonas sp. MYb46]PRB52163.1 hypothetical protein CQ028_06285 [Brevundimonas sp. MYb33]